MSFWRLYYHLIWSTKDRLPLITQEIDTRLYDYILRKSAETGAYIYALNGWTDHIHLVAAIPPELAVSNYVKQVKGASSHFVNHEIKPERRFAWQRGYGVLTIGERQRQAAIDYVNDQKQHHMEQTASEWLERLAESQQGPQHPAMIAGQRSRTISETHEAYSLDPDTPF